MIELVCVKTKDNGVTAEDLNRFKLSLDRMRVLRELEFQACRLNVLTDDKAGIDPALRIIPFLGNEQITNNKFLPIELHNYDDFFGAGTKVMYFDTDIIARDLTGGFCFDGIPDKGTTHETTHKFTEEETKEIEDNALPFLQLAPNWWGVEENAPAYHDCYFGFVAGDTRALYRKFMQDPEGYQDKYNTLGEFYANEFEGFILDVELGSVGGYYVNDAFKNEQVIQHYEDKIRPLYEQNPNLWRGMGGEPEAKYIEWNHEYRDITKQCSLLYLDRGEDRTDPFEDRYLHLWVL